MQISIYFCQWTWTASIKFLSFLNSQYSRKLLICDRQWIQNQVSRASMRDEISFLQMKFTLSHFETLKYLIFVVSVAEEILILAQQCRTMSMSVRSNCIVIINFRIVNPDSSLLKHLTQQRRYPWWHP